MIGGEVALRISQFPAELAALLRSSSPVRIGQVHDDAHGALPPWKAPVLSPINVTT